MSADPGADRAAGPHGHRAAHAAADREHRRRLDEVFGEVLPETTRDERDDAVPGGSGDDWLRAQVPPHHGG